MFFNFKNHIQKESKSVLLYSITTLITSLGSFIIIPIYWNILSPTDYGYIAIAELISGVLAIFLGLNLDQGITRFYYEWKEKHRKNALGTLFITSWISIILMFPVVFFVVYKFRLFIFPNVDFDLILLALTISFLSPFEKIPNVIYRMEEKPLIFSSLTIFNFIINHSLMIYFIFFMNTGVFGYFYSMIFSKSILVFVNIFFIANYINFNFNFKYLKNPLIFSLKFIPSDFISVVTNQGDKFFIQLFLNIYSLGLYNLCLKFGNLLTSLHVVIKLVYVPFLIKADSLYTDGKELISEFSSLYLIPLFIGFVGLTIFSNDLILYINNVNYFDLNKYLTLVCLSIFIPMLYLYLSPGIYLSTKNEYLIYPSIISSVLFFFLAPFLLERFDLFGLIFAKIISGSAYLTICIFLSIKLYGISFKYKSFIFLFLLSLLTISIEHFTANLFLRLFIFLIYLLIIFFIYKKKYYTSKII